ncbi:MAG: hypothetical protein AAB459_03330 [Patescibacteria group bacterium]|jgi:hypothetical protein
MKKISKKTVIVSIALIVATMLLGYAIQKTSIKEVKSNPVPDEILTTGVSLQYEGPTEEEIKNSEKHKQDISDSKIQTPTPGSLRKVNPLITSINTSELRGYISGIAEEGGTCSATYTNGTNSFTKSSLGVLNTSNTVCGEIKTNSSDFNLSGTWRVILSYTSKTSQGSSEASSVEVQQ